MFRGMTASDIIRQIEALSPEEQAKMRDWLQNRAFEESPEMLSELDAAARSADVRGTVPLETVRRELRSWTIKSA